MKNKNVYSHQTHGSYKEILAVCSMLLLTALLGAMIERLTLCDRRTIHSCQYNLSRGANCSVNLRKARI